MKPALRKPALIITLIAMGIPMVVWGFRQQSGPRTGAEQDFGWAILMLGFALIGTGLSLRTNSPGTAVCHGLITPVLLMILFVLLFILALLINALLIE